MEGRDEVFRRPAGPKLGFDENEQKEFSRALKQGLLVQTPLQVLLETLFSRLQTQAGLFSELSRKVERLESRDIGGHELLHRLQICEGRLSTMTVGKLSPFNQQEILNRLDELQAQTEQLRRKAAEEASETEAQEQEGVAPEQESVASPARPHHGHAGMEARMVAVEEKLNGVYNLAGKLIAVDFMAAELGVQVPDLEYNPGMSAEDFLLPKKPAVGFHTGAAALPPAAQPTASGTSAFAPASTSFAPVVSAASEALSPPPLSPRLRPKSLQLVQEQSAATMDSERASPFGGVRASELRAQINEVATANEALQATVEALRHEVHQARSELTQRQSHLASRVDSLESCTLQLKQHVTEEMDMFKTAAKRDPEVSFADFSLLQNQMALTMRETQGTRETVTGLKEQEVKALSAAVAELREGLRKVDAPRDTDALFHQRLAVMESKYNDIRSQVQQAAVQALQGAAKVSDLEDLARDVDNKASQLDIRQLAAQQQTLAQSVNGMAEWLSVRPETADGAKGTGASATKFKCLTCDREMRTQSASNGNPTLKGVSLPKLDGLHGQTSSTPIGPGLNSVRTKIPPIILGQDLGPLPEEVGAPRTALDLMVSPTNRTAAYNTASNNSAAAMIRLPPGPRVPVFI